ncbi:MAG: hypothetical protein ACK55I_02015, partial [bacterium]
LLGLPVVDRDQGAVLRLLAAGDHLADFRHGGNAVLCLHFALNLDSDAHVARLLFGQPLC